jgi:hypothetical protein
MGHPPVTHRDSHLSEFQHTGLPSVAMMRWTFTMPSRFPFSSCVAGAYGVETGVHKLTPQTQHFGACSLRTSFPPGQ